jgi:hypothetical protein
VAANQVVELEGQVRLPLPSGWSVDSIEAGFPYRLISPDSSCEMLVFRSEVSADLAVRSRETLRVSVDSIVQTVIKSLPHCEIMTNHGFSDGQRAWFVLEFVTTDTSLALSLWHRLQGTIYQRPDGRQLLFTLWGRRPVSAASDFDEDLRAIQDGFTFSGPTTADVFALPNPHYYWYLAALLLLLIMLFYLRRRRLAEESMRFAAQPNVWRCECGRMNHDENLTCRRCGRACPTNLVT